MGMTDADLVDGLLFRMLGPNPDNAMADSARLDWLEAKRPTINPVDHLTTTARIVVRVHVFGSGITYRDAVDAAMKADQACREELEGV